MSRLTTRREAFLTKLQDIQDPMSHQLLFQFDTPISLLEHLASSNEQKEVTSSNDYNISSNDYNTSLNGQEKVTSKELLANLAIYTSQLEACIHFAHQHNLLTDFLEWCQSHKDTRITAQLLANRLPSQTAQLLRQYIYNPK